MPTVDLGLCPVIAHHVSWRSAAARPKSGLDRKSRSHGKNDEFDPQRSSMTSFIFLLGHHPVLFPILSLRLNCESLIMGGGMRADEMIKYRAAFAAALTLLVATCDMPAASENIR